MLNLDEDAVVCDLAETYGIFDYKGLSLKKVATFCCGLREDSRIKMRLSNMKVPSTTLLLAASLDQLNFLSWSKTENAQHGKGKPASVVGAILGTNERSNESFNTADEFERFRHQLLERM